MSTPRQWRLFAFNRRQFSVGLASIGLAGIPVVSTAEDKAASYPTKPIKVLISVPPGGTMDVLTRAISNAVRESLGVIILDHKSGANGNIAMEAAKVADPDGHTLLLGTASMLTMNPHTYKEFRVDVFKDFEPIVLASRFELALAVHASVPANTLPELLTWLKANPSKAVMASYGAGTPGHFLIEMLSAATGIKIQHVPYRGATQAMQDLMGGQVLMLANTVGGTVPFLQSGKIKVLATSGQKRSPFMPAIPTFVELGYPSVTATAWFSYLAPKGTPIKILDRLNAEFNKAIQSREVRAQLLSNGMYPVGGTRAELAQTMKVDYAHWGQVVKATGFEAN